MEELSWASQGSFGERAVEKWKSYFGLLKDYFGQRAVEDLSWATRGLLW